MSSTTRTPWWKSGLLALRRWIDTSVQPKTKGGESPRTHDWFQSIPYLAVHLMCFGVIWVGASWIAAAVAFGFYAVRMFVVTAFYHRYFSHRSYKLNRFWQFVAGFLGCLCVQRGPLWWAAHHRHHHRYSDLPEDTHSPKQRGFWYSHIGWILDPKNSRARLEDIPDFAKYPELRFLDRFCVLIATFAGIGMYYLGVLLAAVAPELGTSGAQMLVWGFFISTVILHHATFTINSLTHVWGRQRYRTSDTSRNHWFLAIITFGEGWHNNHHHYQASTRQGWFWWEYDFTYYGLKLLSFVGIVKGIKRVPDRVKLRTKLVVEAEERLAEGKRERIPEVVGAGESVS